MSNWTRFEKEANGNSEMAYWIEVHIQGVTRGLKYPGRFPRIEQSEFISMLGIWEQELGKDLHLDQEQGCILLQRLSRFCLQCHMCQLTEIH